MNMSAGSARAGVRPFVGTVNVNFSSAVVASSERALVMQAADGREIYYLPLKDVYMTFFEVSDRTDQTSAGPGPARFWHVGAVGERATDAMWSHEPLEPGYEALQGYAGFDPSKVRIEAVPLPDREHRTEWP